MDSWWTFGRQMMDDLLRSEAKATPRLQPDPRFAERTTSQGDVEKCVLIKIRDTVKQLPHHFHHKCIMLQTHSKGAFAVIRGELSVIYGHYRFIHMLTIS